MEFDLEVTLRAENDIADAITYYSGINPELGGRFWAEIKGIYDQLEQNPFVYSFISSNSAGKFRDVKLRSFPYILIYETIESTVYVTAVMHTNRRPFKH